MDQREVLCRFLEEAQSKNTRKEELANEFLVSPAEAVPGGSYMAQRDEVSPTLPNQSKMGSRECVRSSKRRRRPLRCLTFLRGLRVFLGILSKIFVLVLGH